MNNSDVERYPIKADRHSSHSQILRLCGQGENRRLLDVGCARGHLSSALTKEGWNVTGIEYDASDAAIARDAGIEVIIGPAEETLNRLDERFDAIVFADVLEHFVHPLDVLSQTTSLLTPNGRVIISIPNVAHLSVRLQLLLGSFNYADRGILDRTHLHFYTKKTLKELISGAGLSVIHLDATPAPIEEVLPKLRTIRPLRVILELNAWMARKWKSAFAYQYIVVAEIA